LRSYEQEVEDNEYQDQRKQASKHTSCTTLSCAGLTRRHCVGYIYEIYGHNSPPKILTDNIPSFSGIYQLWRKTFPIDSGITASQWTQRHIY
jgi:hypothetical protein